MWELHRGYLESYTDFPDTQTMVEGIDRNVKILLIHGTKDRSIPLEMAEGLHAAFLKHRGAAGSDSDGGVGVQLVTVEGGNHLLSSSKHLDKALKAIRELVTDSECVRV
mmetsp:Transcript_44264/g.125223  ORF Transcript_44264/g.125223 Transcript_44264/m.125223 type:complete len:109 (-) Transcript_44264:29-355(-)